jgi:hypothetical protein
MASIPEGFHTNGYNPVSDFDPPRGRICSRSYSRQYQDLFQKPTFAHIATLWPDGAPHVTPVWVDYDVETERVVLPIRIDRVSHNEP